MYKRTLVTNTTKRRKTQQLLQMSSLYKNIMSIRLNRKLLTQQTCSTKRISGNKKAASSHIVQKVTPTTSVAFGRSVYRRG